jgi:uncharacterized protein DUF3300
MKARAKYVSIQVLVLLLSVSVLFAQETVPLAPAPMQTKPVFTQQQLDQMLAPVALYPDSLLSQILMASTYPLEIVEAARWSKTNPNLKGDDAVKAAEQNGWDPSVTSLVAFPQVLTMMDSNLSWTERLGDAFLAQQPQVMETVQNLRQRAYAAGNLRSNDQVRVDQQGQTIVIEPPNPQVVYVPYYDPRVVYGPWWWPEYPPVYWGPWPGYYVPFGFGAGFAWGVGITVGAGFFFGAFDWPHRHIRVLPVNNFYYRNNVVRVWEHDPVHRLGVPYRGVELRQRFGRMSAAPEARRDFRGHTPASFEGRSGFGNRPDTRGDPGRRSEEHSVPPVRSNVPEANRPNVRSAPSRPSAPSVASSPHVEQRPHAFEGVGRGPNVRDYSARGHASSPGHASSQGHAPGQAGSPNGGAGSQHGGGGKH